MTNDQAARLLRGIYDVAMSVHPIADRDDIDPRFTMALGCIAGAASEGINAVNEDRNLRWSNLSGFDFPRSQSKIREG